MTPLFDDAGRSAIAGLARRRTLYGFDFDGTLAPIVPRPADAAPAPSTIARLAALAALAPVAIVTGRRVDDVRPRLAFAPRHVVGNHGMEGLPEADAASAARHRDAVRAWRMQWTAALGGADTRGIVVEDKEHSWSIHYRHAADASLAQATIVNAIARLDPRPRVIGGKRVFNLLPDGALDKGGAMTALVRAERCDGVFYIGDDDTDEAVFDVAGPAWVTVRVGVSSASRARYFVDDQPDVDRCLDLVVDALRARDAR